MPTTRAPELTAQDWEMFRALGRRITAKQFDAFQDQGEGCGWCRHPIRIRGTVTVDDGTVPRIAFSTAKLPDGVTMKACGSRRENRCPACAAMYRGDARHLVRAGLMGGKNVSETVAGFPAVFATLTAPSFGAVHVAKRGGPCHPGAPKRRCPHGRRLSCFDHHDIDSEIVGSPLCFECYDYAGAVLHNACSPELWRRTTIYVLRQLATVLGHTQAETRKMVRLSFCRVAEFQRRGVVHLHAVMRADGPDGPDGTAPPVSAEQLAQAVLMASRAVSVHHPRGAARWGEQIDVKLLDRSREGTKTISGYVAKYACKSSEDAGMLDTRIRSAEDLARRRLPAHLRRMAEVAWAFGGEAGYECLHLRRHAHGLGYGGHFLSKSLRYSTTLGALRAARQEWQRNRAHKGSEIGDRSVNARWRAVGIGWANRGEATWAEWQRRRREDERRCAAEDFYSRDPKEAA